MIKEEFNESYNNWSPFRMSLERSPVPETSDMTPPWGEFTDSWGVLSYGTSRPYLPFRKKLSIRPK